MIKIKSLWFDVFLLSAMYILVTGGTIFLTPHLAEFVRQYPRWHRSLLSVLTLLFIVFFAFRHIRGHLEDESLLVRFVTKLNLPAIRWVWIIYFVLAVIFAYSSFIRHHVFQSSFDLAIFAQAVWNTWHGDFLFSSIKGGIVLLGDHVSPVLALLAPLYGLWNDAAVLLFLQAFIAASSIFPIFLIARKILNENGLALSFVIAYALYLPLRNAVRFDFHPELLGDPFILWAFYLALKNQVLGASLCLIFVLLTKETACPPIAMLGIYWAIFQKKRLFGITWFLIAVAIFFIDVSLISPYFAKAEYFYLRGNYLAWRQLGIVPFSQFLFQPSTFTYIKKIYLPLGFFSFLSPPTFILTFPVLLQNLTARNPLARSIFFHYTTFLTPFVFISGIYGFHNFMNWACKQDKRNPNQLTTIGVCWLLGWSLLLTGVSEYHVIRECQRRDNEHLRYVRQYLKSIPSNVSVRTHELFAPHLINRKELYIYENQHPKEGGSYKAQNADYVVIDRMLLGDNDERDLKLLLQHGYHIKDEHEGLIILIKK